MSPEALQICETSAREGAVVLVNTSLVHDRPRRTDLRVIEVPCNQIAEEIGDVRIANMIMMGALSKVTGAVKLDKLDAVLESFFPESKRKLVPLNVKAIEAGKAAV